MNATFDRDVRDQLERAVEVIDPTPPPLDGLRARAVRRRRVRRTGAGFLAIAAVAAIVIVAVVVVPGSKGNQTLRSADQPSRASLTAYADAHGALKQLAGPYESGAGYFGAFTTKAGVAVATYRDDHWVQSGTTVTKLGSGRFINRLRFAAGLWTSGETGAVPPSIYLRTIGGDVSYFGSVLRESNGVWAPARFSGCGHRDACTPGTSEPYLHESNVGLVSVNNSCTPYCAAGNEFKVRWRWEVASQRFIWANVTKLRH